MAPPSPTETRLARVGVGLKTVGDTFQVLALSVHTPFLSAISLAATALASSIQAIRQNERDCAELLEQTYAILNALVPLYMNVETRGELPPRVLSSMGQFAETLHIVHNFVDAQRDGSRFRKLFRQAEMSSLLKHAKAGLQAALEAFQVSNVGSMAQMLAIQDEAEEMHQKVLEFIAELTERSEASSIFSASYSSSRSFSLLPSKPKIFCGRDTELDQILRAFTSSSPSPSHPRIAILGPGGIGKTSLAKAVLHDPDIAGRYDKQRYFVTCDAANTRGGIAEMVASNLGLKPSKDATRPVVRHLKAMTSPCFLVLDNLETAWERQEERAEVEEFLALLAEVESVALLITMRGAERPAGVQWSRPFLPPLAPLSQTAARQMFVDIADHTEEDQDLEDVLRLTDNLPLAITLLAHLVDSEGCATVLARWENEKTLLVSDGYDRNSNLNLSIQLSLSSPRIALLPQCAELLGLLALSPDGVSDVELQLMNLPIHDVLRCKTALLRTALAYNTEQNRLKVLVPIQEYILRFEPPGRALVRAALRHYLNLLELDKMYEGTTSSPAIVQRLQANLHNMQRIVVNELAIADAGEDVELGTLVQTILELNNFSQVLLNIQQIPLMLRIPDLLERVGHDPRLEVMYITEQLNSQPHVPTEKSQAEALIKRGREHVESGRLQDKEQQCKFYSILGNFYTSSGTRSTPDAYKAYETGLAIAVATDQQKRQITFVRRLAYLRSQDGEYEAAQRLAREAQLLAKVTGNLYREAGALGVEALCCVALGELAAAGDMYTHARELYTLCGMTGSYADCSLAHDQAELHLAKSEYPEALRIFVDVLHHMSIPGDPATGISGQLELSIVHARALMGEPRVELQPLLDRAQGLLQKVGYSDNLREGRLVHAHILYADGDARGAYEELIALVRPGKWVGSVELQRHFIEKLSFLSAIGGVREAESWSTVLLLHSLKLKAKPDVHKALKDLGVQFFNNSRDDLGTAQSLLEVALGGLTRMDIHRGRAECLSYLGEIALRRGDKAKAVEHWSLAARLFERCSLKTEVVRVEERLAVVQ